MAISEETLEKIRTAVYGRDVLDAILTGFQETYNNQQIEEKEIKEIVDEEWK